MTARTLTHRPDTARLARRFGDALRAADGPGAEAVALHARACGLSMAEVHEQVVTPAMVRIGELWEQGAITVADEHLATSIAQRVLASLCSHTPPAPPSRRGRVLLAGPTGEHHHVGLRMAADVLEQAGFEVVHLGTDVPPDAIAAAVVRHAPDVLGLTLTLGTGGDELERSLRAVLDADPDVRILLGGSGIPAGLVDLGFGRAAGVEDVVEAVEALLGGGPRHVAPPERPGALSGTMASAPQLQGVGTVEALLAGQVEELADLVRRDARQSARLRALAFEDPLCGLPNRRAFDDRFGALAAAHDLGDRRPVAVLLLDVDRFKVINDGLGHAVGDRVLQHVAAVLRQELGPEDLPARMGGDEFVALLVGATAEGARGVAGRIAAAVAAPYDGPPVQVSIGVATFDGDRRATLIRADEALYARKRAR